MQKIAYDLTEFYDEKRPFNVLTAGVSFCDEIYCAQVELENFYYIGYLYQGSGMLEIDGQVLSLRSGDVYLLKKGSSESCWFEGLDPIKRIWICFNGKFADGLFASYLENDVRLIRHCDVSEDMERFLRILENSNEDYEQMMDEAALAAVQIVLKLRRGIGVRQRSLPEQIKEWLDCHVEENVKLEHVCEHFHYSRNHLINQFRSHYQVTPYQYLKIRKMEAAKRYLLESDLSIHDIAVRLAYTDENYFHSCFKEATGITPGAFRKQRDCEKS